MGALHLSGYTPYRYVANRGASFTQAMVGYGWTTSQLQTPARSKAANSVFSNSLTDWRGLCDMNIVNDQLIACSKEDSVVSVWAMNMSRMRMVAETPHAVVSFQYKMPGCEIL